MTLPFYVSTRQGATKNLSWDVVVSEYMKLTDLFPACGCGATVDAPTYRITRALFVSTGDNMKYLRKLKSRESGGVMPGTPSVQHWKVSTTFNAQTQIYGVKKQWYLGLPRLLYPSLVRFRSLLNAIPQDSLVSGALWILFEVDAPEHVRQDILFILISLLVHVISTNHPTVDIHANANDFIAAYTPASRSVDRYIRDVKEYLGLRQPVQLSHIIVRSFVYTGGLEDVGIPGSRQPPSSSSLKIIMTVCNSRIGQLDQTYFAQLSNRGGIVPITQSLNATDEVIFSIYVRSQLVSRFQTVGFALVDPLRGPLKLYRDELNENELFLDGLGEEFFFEIFAECLQWMSETGGTSVAQGTLYTDGNNTMDDSEAILNVAHRLQPQSGVALSNEEKYAIVLSALPSYAFRVLSQEPDESDEEYTLRSQCQICLCDYEDGEQVRVLPCMHAFHGACAESWLHVRLQCPNCSADIAELLTNPRNTLFAGMSSVSFSEDHGTQMT